MLKLKCYLLFLLSNAIFIYPSINLFTCTNIDLKMQALDLLNCYCLNLFLNFWYLVCYADIIMKGNVDVYVKLGKIYSLYFDTNVIFKLAKCIENEY